MAELTQSVSNEKVSTRWEETYVSRGINRQMSVIPPGLYDGGDVDYSTTTTLRIAAGKYVVQDTANGFGMILRDPDATEIDCSSLFPVATQKDWYVGLRITYTTGAATTCEFFMTDALPLDQYFVGKDELVFCQVTLHVADTGLNQATIIMLDGAKPLPYPDRDTDGAVLSSDREYGLISNVQSNRLPSLDEKNGLGGYPSAPSSSNKVITEAYLGNSSGIRVDESATISSGKFQISGNVYIGQGSAGSANKYMWLFDSSDNQVPAKTASGSLIYVSSVYKNNDSAPVVPSSDADTDGYYANPWIHCTSSDGTPPTTDILVSYTKKSTLLGDLGAQSSPALTNMVRNGHSETISTKDISDDYSRWSFSGNLQGVLSTILTGISNLYQDERTMGYWRLTWRNERTENVNPSAEAVSLYAKNKKYCLILGPAYLEEDACRASLSLSATASVILVIFDGESSVSKPSGFGIIEREVSSSGEYLSPDLEIDDSGFSGNFTGSDSFVYAIGGTSGSRSLIKGDIVVEDAAIIRSRPSEIISLAVDGVADLDVDNGGFLIVGKGGYVDTQATFVYGGLDVTKLGGSSTLTDTKDTASKINVYYEAGYKVQNKLASSVDIMYSVFCQKSNL